MCCTCFCNVWFSLGSVPANCHSPMFATPGGELPFHRPNGDITSSELQDEFAKLGSDQQCDAQLECASPRLFKHTNTNTVRACCVCVCLLMTTVDWNMQPTSRGCMVCGRTSRLLGHTSTLSGQTPPCKYQMICLLYSTCEGHVA